MLDTTTLRRAIRAITATLFVASFAALSLAQDKPNFNGTWKLNVAKSDFGPVPAPDSQTDIIDLKDPALKVTVNGAGAQGTIDYTIDTTLDGKETAVKMGPRDVKLTASWDGPVLVVTSKLSFNDQPVTLGSRWSVSADGNTLTQNTHITSAMGEFDTKSVFDKQSGETLAKAPEAPKAIAPAVGGPKPNFSGVWKLNNAKSDFGVMPAPDTRTDTIEHTDPALKLSRNETGAEGPRKYTLNLSTDGKEVANDLGPAQAAIVGNWDGSSLVAVIKLKLQDQDITIKQVSTLSEDGKTLTNKNHITSALGELDQKEVYDKQ